MVTLNLRAVQQPVQCNQQACVYDNSGSGSLVVNRTGNNWTENGITWNNAPAVSTTIASLANVVRPPGQGDELTADAGPSHVPRWDNEDMAANIFHVLRSSCSAVTNRHRDGRGPGLPK
jgi:hypothetical protein